MATKTRVLVFPCGSEIGLEIHRSLMWARQLELWGASSVDSNHGKYVYKNYLDGIPFEGSIDLLEKLRRVIVQHGIEFIYPAHDSTVLTLAEHQNSLPCTVIGSPAETCRVCRSKRQTYERLSSALRVPKVYANPSEITRFPVFLKPEVGQGSKGTYVAGSPTEVDFCTGKDPSLLLLEYLPGREFTIDCFTDRHGKLRFAGARERIRIQNGISVATRPVTGAEYGEIAETINSTLRFRGAWFFQLKENARGELTLLEVEPRIAGAMGLYRNVGVNFALLSLFDAMDLDVEIVTNGSDLEMDRALISRFQGQAQRTYEHVYIDLDDCLVLNGSVNTLAIAFLYQCLNQGVGLHLITRHKGVLEHTLARHRLGALFDTIECCADGTSKSSFIKKKNAIFIDDSFSERLDVHRRLGIPVFALDALESLIDWKA